MINKVIGKLVGKLTLPETVYVDSCGDYWVEYNPYVNYSCSAWLKFNTSGYPYNYMKIEQNWFGVWVETGRVLSKHSPLHLLEEIKG